MPLVTQFEKNGITVDISEPLDPIGMPGRQTVAIVGTAPDKGAQIAFNVPYRVNTLDGVALLDTVGNEAGTLYRAAKHLLKRTQVPVYLIVVPEGADDAETEANVIGGVDGSSGLRQGIEAIRDCNEAPMLIAAPGFSHSQAVVDALKSIASKIFAIPVVDGPSTTTQAVIDHSGLFSSSDPANDDVVLVDPSAQIYSTASQGLVYVSGSVAGLPLLAERDPWEGPGHNGARIFGTMRPISYSPLEVGGETDQLNANGICALAKLDDDGFALIGNRTITGKFIGHRGLKNVLARKLAAVLAKSLGKNMDRQFFEQELRRINRWGARLKAGGVLIDLNVYLHPDLNTQASYDNGTWYLVVDYGRYSPNEHTVLKLSASEAIVTEFVEDVVNG